MAPRPNQRLRLPTGQLHWVALRRSPKDQRARRQLRRVVFLIVWVAYAAVVAILILHSAAQGSLLPALGQMALYVALPGGVTLYAAWSERRDIRLAEESSSTVPMQVKLAIYREAYLLATLLERASSERALEKVAPSNEAPLNSEIWTHRVHIDRLRDGGMMEGIEPQFADLLLTPDGRWVERQTRQVEQMWEFLAVLGWVLGLSELRPLTLPPEYTMSLATRIVENREPGRLPVLASWDIRPERDQTDAFFALCWVELVARGDVRSENPEEVLKIHDELQTEWNTGDYLMEVRAISELPGDILNRTAHRARRRAEILRQLVEILSGEQPVAELHRLLINFLSPVTDEPSAS